MNQQKKKRGGLLIPILLFLGILCTAPFLLLKAGARHDRPCQDLAEAAAMGDVEAVRLALRAGADANCVTDLGGTTPLNEAAKNHLHGAEEVQILLAAGAKVNDLDIEGLSPLDHAATPMIAELLKSRGGHSGGHASSR